MFAFLVYAAGTEGPVANSSSLLLGHTAAYLGAGILIALGPDQITSYLAQPKLVDHLIGLVADALVYFATGEGLF